MYYDNDLNFPPTFSLHRSMFSIKFPGLQFVDSTLSGKDICNFSFFMLDYSIKKCFHYFPRSSGGQLHIIWHGLVCCSWGMRGSSCIDLSHLCSDVSTLETHVSTQRGMIGITGGREEGRTSAKYFKTGGGNNFESRFGCV